MYKTKHTTIQTQQALLDAIYSWILELGWTLYDDISSTNKVFTTTGETPKHLPIYINIYIGGTSYINCDQYGGWATATHTGVHPLHTGNMVIRSFEPTSYAPALNIMSLFMIGSKDYMIFSMSQYVNATVIFADTYGFGYVPVILCEMCYEHTDPVSPGSNVVLQLNSVVDVQVGVSYQIMDRMGATGCELSRVIEKNTTNTTVTLETVTRTYSDGVFFGYNYFPVFKLSGGYIDMISPTFKVGTTASIRRLLFNDIINGANNDTMPVGGSSSMFPNTQLLLNNPIVKEQNEIIPIGRFNFELKSMRGNLTRTIGKTIIIFNNDAPISSPSYPTSFAVNYTTITDSRKNFTVNELVGKYVVILTGWGAGQSRQILSNTATTYTFINPFIDIINKTSQYVIVDNVFRSLQAWGGSDQGNLFAKDLF